MSNGLTILSLGWGVQSWTLAAMAALGEVDKPDYILHADTTWEHEHTYKFAEKWLPWLEDHGMTVITCIADSTKNVIDKKNVNVFLPAYTKSGEMAGALNRQCTERWKIRPQRREVSMLLKKHGLKKSEGVVTQLIGISMDEWSRMKDSSVKYIKMDYPLVDMRMSRKDCIDWLLDHRLEVPKKSSCVMCPYHSLFAWWELKQSGGIDWDTATGVDLAIRDKRPGFDCYLTKQMVPLVDTYFGEFTEPTLFDLSEYACDSGHCFL